MSEETAPKIEISSYIVACIPKPLRYLIPPSSNLLYPSNAVPPPDVALFALKFGSGTRDKNRKQLNTKNKCLRHSLTSAGLSIAVEVEVATL
ncbi:hypothetical protein Trydic_g6334 [Trypoxylus dichotomus]